MRAMEQLAFNRGRESTALAAERDRFRGLAVLGAGIVRGLLESDATPAGLAGEEPFKSFLAGVDAAVAASTAHLHDPEGSEA
jgi:hypothetical protein